MNMLQNVAWAFVWVLHHYTDIPISIIKKISIFWLVNIGITIPTIYHKNIHAATESNIIWWKLITYIDNLSIWCLEVSLVRITPICEGTPSTASIAVYGGYKHNKYVLYCLVLYHEIHQKVFIYLDLRLKNEFKNKIILCPYYLPTYFYKRSKCVAKMHH